MKLPNGEHAIVDLAKLRDYCLDPMHPRGRHKARVFAAALGLYADHSEHVRELLLRAAQTEEVAAIDQDAYGQRYSLDFILIGLTGQAMVRSSWIIRDGEDFPRLTSCFVL